MSPLPRIFERNVNDGRRVRTLALVVMLGAILTLIGLALYSREDGRVTVLERWQQAEVIDNAVRIHFLRDACGSRYDAELRYERDRIVVALEVARKELPCFLLGTEDFLTVPLREPSRGRPFVDAASPP